MLRVLLVCDSPGKSGPIRARPTGRQRRRLLYPARQRVRREAVFVGSVLSFNVNLSAWSFLVISHFQVPVAPSFLSSAKPRPPRSSAPASATKQTAKRALMTDLLGM